MPTYSQISQKAHRLGFDVLRVVNVRDLSGKEGWHQDLEAFLSREHHGTMEWMEERADERADPQKLWPDTQSIVMLGMNYAPDTNPLEDLINKSNAAISVYARRRDYHDVIKGKLKELAGFLVKDGGKVKVFVDTAPVMEKPLAHACGLGWQGKHTVLVSRDFGSWLFLGAIFTTLDLPSDKPETDHCGTCTRCLDICPTQAFPAPYQLDARRCISYLTIEHKGPIDREFRAKMGNRIFGCDDCLAVCPWNKFAKASQETRLSLQDELKSLPLQELVQLDDAAFRAMFKGTPIKRTGRERFLRNALIAMGNSQNSDLIPHLLPLLHDPSPLLRGMAVWALGQLDPLMALKLKSQYLTSEIDSHVKDEWHDLLASSSFNNFDVML